MQSHLDEDEDIFGNLPALDPFDIKKEEIAAQLSALMIHCEVSRSELADRTGWKRSRVTRVLHGNENVTAKTIYEIALALGYDFDVTFRLHASQCSAQPWHGAAAVVAMPAVKREAVSVVFQTADQVAQDLNRGVGKPFYASLNDAAFSGTYFKLEQQHRNTLEQSFSFSRPLTNGVTIDV